MFLAEMILEEPFGDWLIAVLAVNFWPNLLLLFKILGEFFAWMVVSKMANRRLLQLELGVAVLVWTVKEIFKPLARVVFVDELKEKNTY